MDPKELKGLMEAYQQVNASQEEIEEASYSAKAARAGKDIGKPGKAFSKIAASAAKRYGSEERGKKVAGAVLAKLRKEEIEILEDVIDENRMASRMEKMPSAPAKVGKATHSIKDLAPSKPPTPEEKAKARKALGLGEAVKGESSERRRDLAAQRRAGDKPLSPAKGRDNANKMQRDIKYFDKLTKKNKNVVGLVSNEEVDLFDTVLEFLQVEGYENPEQLMTELSSNHIDAILEAQAARNNPEKYEAGEKKKNTGKMPPRGDKRREDFEKWYAANGPK
jgi:hypothetical protein